MDFIRKQDNVCVYVCTAAARQQHAGFLFFFFYDHEKSIIIARRATVTVAVITGKLKCNLYCPND